MTNDHCKKCLKQNKNLKMVQLLSWGVASGGGGGGGVEPLSQKPHPLELPNEMTLCTGVYGELPFWVLVSTPCRPLLLKSLATPLHLRLCSLWVRPYMAPTTLGARGTLAQSYTTVIIHIQGSCFRFFYVVHWTSKFGILWNYRVHLKFMWSRNSKISKLQNPQKHYSNK